MRSDVCKVSSSNGEFCILQISTLVDTSSAFISLGSCFGKGLLYLEVRNLMCEKDKTDYL